MLQRTGKNKDNEAKFQRGAAEVAAAAAAESLAE